MGVSNGKLTGAEMKTQVHRRSQTREKGLWGGQEPKDISPLDRRSRIALRTYGGKMLNSKKRRDGQDPRPLGSGGLRCTHNCQQETDIARAFLYV
jgi:hypothetical protein